MEQMIEVPIELGAICRIILNPMLTTGLSDEPARRHRRKRIQKKWLKRYGYKEAIDQNIYVVEDPPRLFESCQTAPEKGARSIMMHPAIYRKIVRAFAGDESKAADAVYKSVMKRSGT